MLGAIWAQDRRGAIGKNGTLAWHLPEDMAFFRTMTATDPVIMGRKTYDSLPPRFRPLPHRENIVLTRSKITPLRKEATENELLTYMNHPRQVGEHYSSGTKTAWVIGGQSIYRELLPLCSFLCVTRVYTTIEEPDAFAPRITSTWKPWEESSHGYALSQTGLKFKMTLYIRRCDKDESRLPPLSIAQRFWKATEPFKK